MYYVLLTPIIVSLVYTCFFSYIIVLELYMYAYFIRSWDITFIRTNVCVDKMQKWHRLWRTVTLVCAPCFKQSSLNFDCSSHTCSASHICNFIFDLTYNRRHFKKLQLLFFYFCDSPRKFMRSCFFENCIGRQTLLPLLLAKSSCEPRKAYVCS